MSNYKDVAFTPAQKDALERYGESAEAYILDKWFTPQQVRIIQLWSVKHEQPENAHIFFTRLQCKYLKALYKEATPTRSPIMVGDQITKLYFNTSVTPDFEAIKADSSMIILESDNALLNGQRCAIKCEYIPNATVIPIHFVFVDCSQMQAGLWFIMEDNRGTLFYINQDFSDGRNSYNAGWQMNMLDIEDEDKWGVNNKFTVTAVGGQDTWGSYISKEPF